MSKRFMKLDLQHFAEPAGGNEPAQAGQGIQTQGQITNHPAAQAQTIDYDKLIEIVQGKQNAAEESALKGYLKQQGLSQDEMSQAIVTFKQQKAASQPNIEELQANNQKYIQQIRETQVINKAMLLSGDLGLDIKTIPHIAKLADLSGVFGEDGKIIEDKLKESVNKVLEDVPGFKISTGNNGSNNPGFQQIGGSGQQQNNNQEDLLKGIFGIKK